jgi:hypothetical protein
MLKDWVTLFGDDTGRLTRQTMKELAGLSPGDRRQRTTFAKRLGIMPHGMTVIDELKRESEVWELADDEDESVMGHSTDLDADTVDTVEQLPKQWDASKMNGNLGDLYPEIHDRARIYYRFGELDRPLATPSFFTKNAAVYKNLNILLSHACPHR